MIQRVRHRLLKQRRFRQMLVGAVIISLVIGLLIVPIEQRYPTTAQIETLSDGLWWSVQTLTTVGYGDITPRSDLGRMLGAIMQVLGAIMFGVLIAMIGTTMGRSQEEFYWNRLFERINKLEEELASLRKDTQFIVKESTTLKPSTASKTDPFEKKSYERV